MSERVRITPLLQAELTKQLGKVMDAIDENDLFRAYRCLKTLILVSPPKVKGKVVRDVERLDGLIEKAQDVEGVDLYQSRRQRTLEVTSVLRTELRPLFGKVMDLLYEGGYLESHRRTVETNVPDEVFLFRQK